MRAITLITLIVVFFRKRLCQSLILRHSRRICFFITRWKSRCFALAQHDIQVICSIVTQSPSAEGIVLVVQHSASLRIAYLKFQNVLAKSGLSDY